MDLRTFRRNDPGRAACDAQAAWRRLWADRRAHRPLDTRGPVSNGAAPWPQFGHRGQTHPTLCGAEQLLATELVFEGHMKWAEGDAMTAVERESERRLERDHIRESRKSVAIAGRSGTRWPTSGDTILARRPGCVIPHRLLPLPSKSHDSWRCCVLGCVASDCLYLPVY